MIPREILGPFIGSNVVALVLVVLALKWPRLARVLFAVVFLGAGLFNLAYAVRKPDVYLVYAQWAVEPYRRFILGAFSRHTAAMVATIALGQMAVAALLAAGRRFLWLGVSGGMVFLVAIAPLGVGSAFPSTLIMAVALYLVGQRIRGQRIRGAQEHEPLGSPEAYGGR